MAEAEQEPLSGLAPEPPAAERERPAGAVLGRQLRGGAPHLPARRARVQVIGEVTGLRIAGKSVYFELRDADGRRPLRDVAQRLGQARASRGRGSGRLGGRRLRRPRLLPRAAAPPRPRSASAAPTCGWPARGICSPSSRSSAASSATRASSSSSGGCRGTTLPKTIGIVTGRGSAAEADLIAGLGRRGWAGRAVFAHPPVQDRHAAPKIARALSDLAAIPEVEVILVARGGGSLADLWAFCDETLCRTVAMLRVPVISAVGHESDRTLLDDVAAVCCSTPTHATEEAVAGRRRRCAGRVGRRGGAALAAGGRRGGRGARSPPRRRRQDARPSHRRPAPPPPPEDPRDARVIGPGARARCRARAPDGLWSSSASAMRPCTARSPRPRTLTASADARSPRAGSAAASASRATALERLAQTLAAHRAGAGSRARLRDRHRPGAATVVSTRCRPLGQRGPVARPLRRR